MKDDDVLDVAYPEVFPGATAWAWDERPDDGTIVVTRAGLRKLLRLTRDLTDYVMASMCRDLGMKPDVEEATTLSRQNTRALMSRLSAVWCEGDLIVSGLFVDDDGQPIRNPCAEETREGKDGGA